MSLSTTAIASAFPEERQGIASALNDTVREACEAVGIGLIGSVLDAGCRSSIARDAYPTGMRPASLFGTGS